MSLLGIDVGTTGCKVAVFSEDGLLLSAAYEEYGIHGSRPERAELDAVEVWRKVKHCIRKVSAECDSDPVTALSVSSLGEAMVPVSKGRKILGPSVLNFDSRGEEYLEHLRTTLGRRQLYDITGNILGNHFSLTKLRWIKDHEPDRFRRTFKFLLWGSFVGFMLGAEPAIDYSLANRTLLFDIRRKTWSEELLNLAEIERSKLPNTVPSGTVIGRISEVVARDLGLPSDVTIVAGAHDQCAGAVGCGAIEEGHAMYGMGTYTSVNCVFTELRGTEVMLERGLCTEHHAVPDKYVTLMYNRGGATLQWFRDTFASPASCSPIEGASDIYAEMLSEMPSSPSPVMVLPHFSETGPPEFITDSSGVLAGLGLTTSRGDILKGILEGNTFYLRGCVESLPPTGIEIKDFRVVGGGSRSDSWVQISADIMGRPFVRTKVSEAGTLGAAIIAGVGSGVFPSVSAGVEAMVRLGETFYPDRGRQTLYDGKYEKYSRLWPQMRDYLRELASDLE